MGCQMGKYVTVSVKIPVEVKEQLEKLGIKPSELLRKAIREELMRREIAELNREAEELKHVLKKFTAEFVVNAIREDRER